MQSISILCPSSLLKDKATIDLVNKYSKRITAKITYPDLSVKTKPSDTGDLVKKKQGDAILAVLDKLPQNTALIALDERGKSLDSVAFANELEKFMGSGQSHICFIIGGAFGLTQDVLNKVHLKLSLGKMVWPHRLVSVMVLEQIYRAQSIIAGHPYHKA